MSKKKTGNNQTFRDVEHILRLYGVPDHLAKRLRVALTNDAIQEATAMKYDRLYTAMALAARRAYGFGPERIVRFLRTFDGIAGSVLTDEGHDERDWTDIMQELREETGIVIQTGDDNRLILEIGRK